MWQCVGFCVFSRNPHRRISVLFGRGGTEEAMDGPVWACPWRRRALGGEGRRHPYGSRPESLAPGCRAGGSSRSERRGGTDKGGRREKEGEETVGEPKLFWKQVTMKMSWVDVWMSRLWCYLFSQKNFHFGPFGGHFVGKNREEGRFSDWRG